MLTQSCPTLRDPVDWSLPGTPIPGIFQARILEWVAISSSRGSSQPRDRIRVFCVSCIGRWFFTPRDTWEAYLSVKAGKDLNFLVYLQTPSQVVVCVLLLEASPVCLSSILSCLHPLRIIAQICYLHSVIPKRPWCWERLRTGGERGDSGWDHWRVSSTQWIWVWASSGRWWRAGKPGVLPSMGSQRVRYNWGT